MTKTKVFLGLCVAAGAVAAGVMMRKRGQRKVEGKLNAGGKPGISGNVNRRVSGSATMRSRPARHPQH
ncbi:MAG TPA: hypothetical protein VJS69_09290 [Candidatus Krumholzibacteria bacterium]|nr:hypothetical protein [Candidatus Krumholzibacteria bacterium]